jgi:hypothetical protein
MATRKMAAKRAKKRVTKLKPASSRDENSQTDPAVVAFLRELDHPKKNDIEAVRRIILGVSPKIREGIKWNSPSFRTTDSDYFATLNLRGKGGDERVWLVLHTGAKVKKTKAMKIADPTGLLRWLGKDRCLVVFVDSKDIQAKKLALQSVIREWIRQL